MPNLVKTSVYYDVVQGTGIGEENLLLPLLGPISLFVVMELN